MNQRMTAICLPLLLSALIPASPANDWSVVEELHRVSVPVAAPRMPNAIEEPPWELAAQLQFEGTAWLLWPDRSLFSAQTKAVIAELRVPGEPGEPGPTPDCLSSDSVFRDMSIAHALLHISPADAESPEVQAVLRLARYHRHCGPLVSGLVGAILFSDVLDWLAARGLEGGPSLATYAVNKSEILGIFVREALSTNQLWAEAGALDRTVGRSTRAYVGARVRRMSQRPLDLQWLATQANWNDESLFTWQRFFPQDDYGPQVIQLGEEIDKYAAFLSGKRPKKMATTKVFRPDLGPRNTEPGTTGWAALDIRMVGPDHLRLGRQSLDLVMAQLDIILMQARIVPILRDGARIGFKLSSIKPGSFYAQMGLLDGDTVLRINDRTFAANDAPLEIYESLRKTDRIVVDFVRQQQPRRLTIEIDDGDPRVKRKEVPILNK